MKSRKSTVVMYWETGADWRCPCHEATRHSHSHWTQHYFEYNTYIHTTTLPFRTHANIRIAPISHKGTRAALCKATLLGSHLWRCSGCCTPPGHVTCHNTRLSPPNVCWKVLNETFAGPVLVILMEYVFLFVLGALFVSLVSRRHLRPCPHALSSVQSLYIGLDICSVSRLIVTFVLTEK